MSARDRIALDRGRPLGLTSLRLPARSRMLTSALSGVLACPIPVVRLNAALEGLSASSVSPVKSGLPPATYPGRRPQARAKVAEDDALVSS